MRMKTSRWLPAGLVALALWSAPAVADHDTWGTFMDAAAGALEDGNQAGAEENLQVALEEAEKFGTDDHRLPSTMSALAAVYRSRERYIEADALFHRRSPCWRRPTGRSIPTWLRARWRGGGAGRRRRGDRRQAWPAGSRQLARAVGRHGPGAAGVDTRRPNGHREGQKLISKSKTTAMNTTTAIAAIA